MLEDDEVRFIGSLFVSVISITAGAAGIAALATRELYRVYRR